MSISSSFSIDRAVKLLRLGDPRLIATLLLVGGNLLTASPAAADNPLLIENQSTGSYVNDLDGQGYGITSNLVSVTIAEVAGITITSLGTPSAVTGQVANFDFKIKNVGNDPTQFFLPKAPSTFSGANLLTGATSLMQVVGYIPAGGTQINLATPIDIPKTAGSSTADLADATLGGNTTLGSIPAGAAIIVRVPVTVTATAGQLVSVTLGDTTGAASNNNTPYIPGTNDLYTIDHSDPSTIANEIVGHPINGDATGYRQEASAVQTATVVSGTTTTSNGADICVAAGGVLGTNLFANNGSFGTGSSTASTSSALTSGTTTYTYEAYGTSSPTSGKYAIVNQLSQNSFTSSWHNTVGHTTGLVTDRMMVVNAAIDLGTFYSETLTVLPNQNITFSAWVMNLLKASSSTPATAKPDVAFMINRIGVDDNNNGLIDEPGDGQLITASGSVPDTNNPTWTNYGAVFNTGSATSIEFRFVNNVAGSSGNDLALDDLMATPCTLPTGSISGTLYRDKNVNNAYNSGTDIPMPANIAVNLKNSSGDIVATSYTDATGKYSFTNVPAGTGYTITVALTDSDVPVGVTATANPSGASTTGIQTGIAVTTNETLTDQDFGFTPPPATLSGTVFEDINYGGGAGRNLATVNTSSRDGAIVELYQSNGTYISSTTTAGGGKYSFAGIVPGTYYLRVVNSTVSSSRLGYDNTLIPVQTYRTDAGVTVGTVTAIVDRVGGEKPAVADTGAATAGAVMNPSNFSFTTGAGTATTGGQAESVTTVKVGSDVTGLDFGYNFDTIVNTNDLGQGSLRQFVDNSNKLTNAGLDQVANLAPAPGTTAINPAPGIETSIFMIPNPALTNGAADIALASILTVTDDDTSIDGRTQTANIGDTNTGTLGGSAQPVGVSAQLLPNYPNPEISLSMSTGGSNTIEIKGDGDSVIGLGFSTNINSGIIVSGGSATKPTLIQNNIMGLKPDGTAGSVWQSITANQGINPSKYLNILDNLVSNNSFAGVSSSSQGLIQGNHFIRNGTGSCDDNLSVEQSNLDTITINKNLFEAAAANGIEGYSIPGGVTITENTIRTSGRNGTKCDGSIENNGIRLFGSSSKVQKNIINNNGGAGVVFTGNGGTNNLISRNSLFQNGTLGIDLDAKNLPASLNPSGDGVSPNDGAKDATPNSGMDYPIITSSVLSGGNLTVKGYVGNVSSGSNTFATATLEFFIADDDLNNNGPVIFGDGKSKSHGEGKTYIGGSTPGSLCVTDPNGLFNCTFPAPAGLTNPKNITATATDATGSTSEFSSVPTAKANLLMVKRITAINGDRAKNPNEPTILLNTFTDDTTFDTGADDSNCNWSGATGAAGACTNDYTVGAIDAGKVKSGDEIEYTIYYLNAGDNKATQARICDQLDQDLTFKDDTPTTAPLDIQFFPGGGSITPLTNLTDTDNGQLTTPTLAGDSCNLTANTSTNLSNNVVVVDVGTATAPVMGAISAGFPTSSYGYIRFKATVK